MLCSKCKDKVKTGQVSNLDIKTASFLLEVEKKYPQLQNVSFSKAYDFDDVFAIVFDRGSLAQIRGYERQIVHEIQAKTGKRIKLFERGGSLRKFLEDLFSPISILAINTIWLPDGSEENRVVLARRRSSRLPIALETLKNLAEQVKKVKLRIEFES
jgi:transcription antitermination factor NusA-like protein